MTIEKLEDMQIAYMRRTGGYGEGNRQLMERFKRYLRANGLFRANTTILGIALDDPARTPEDRQRYDVGVVLTGGEGPCGLPARTIAGGRYAVFEVPHTEEGVSDFWRDLPRIAAQLPVDKSRHSCPWTLRDRSSSDMHAKSSWRISASFACLY